MLRTSGFVDDVTVHIMAQIQIQTIGELFTATHKVAPGRSLLSATALLCFVMITTNAAAGRVQSTERCVDGELEVITMYNDQCDDRRLFSDRR